MSIAINQLILFGKTHGRETWAREAVDELAALRAQLEELKAQLCWIPVSERLPEADGEYIVWQVNDLGGFWGECFFEDGAFLTGKRHGEVTHWRYGPPVPLEGEK